VPQEIRILSFTKNELFDALQNYCTHTGSELAEEGRKRTTLQAGGEVEIEQRGENVHFTQTEVAAALILFCALNSIPIARRSSKSLEVVGETLNLRLKMS
jgi:phage host-nuclease inhibitor protein Gam